uniref:Uncharacterized protein n=1 Tax=Utricularia reniformis TaxID=192314 RepID=A0A1Y0AYQ3_9LAMI|nr:hypothetical protein AEK19_MT0411 [Utricularia reniformis]ART30281.1 hypothetical protein AEK19_MT0411 [Utricularia reniformis]
MQWRLYDYFRSLGLDFCPPLLVGQRLVDYGENSAPSTFGIYWSDKPVGELFEI